MNTGELFRKLQSTQGQTYLVECLRAQSLVRGEEELAQALATQVRVEEIPFGTTVIKSRLVRSRPRLHTRWRLLRDHRTPSYQPTHSRSSCRRNGFG